MSNEEDHIEETKSKEEPFEEKRDAKGRRITKKRLESMKKNLANANKSRLAKKHAQNSIQEYEIESESDESSDSSSDSDSDDELLEAVMNKKKKEDKKKDSKKPVPSKNIVADPRLDRLEAIVANLAQNVKKSHKKMKKANKGSKSEKIVLVQPNNRQALPEKKTGSGKQGTDLLVEMLKNNVMF